jgi:5-methylcytosine-specific restriction protein A
VTDIYRRAGYRQNRRRLLADNPPCSVRGCTQPATTADHVLPVSAGGSNDLDNLRPMCAHHNSVFGAEIATARRIARKIGRRSRRW